MSVSVIISNFNGARYLPRLLQTLRAQQDIETQIIIVDRHSTDGSAEFLAEQTDLIVTSESPGTGLVAGYARGAELATREYLFFCNEDMWFEPDTLARLVDAIDLEARVGAADPWQWTYDGKHWIHGGTRFRRARWAPNSPHPRFASEFTVDLPSGALVPYACAGAFLIHRRVYDEIGGWDRSFFLDHEDIDLFIRAWQRGWHAVSVPGARVYHAVNASNAQMTVQKRRPLPVSKRRYISGCASVSVIGLKYFSWWALPMSLAALAARWAGALLRLRWQRLWWELLVGREILARTPAAWRFRRANGSANAHRPGERFFIDPRFVMDEEQAERAAPEPTVADAELVNR